MGGQINYEPRIEHDRRIFWHKVPLVGVILSKLMGHTCPRIAIDNTSTFNGQHEGSSSEADPHRK